jgi:hypothetical protein
MKKLFYLAICVVAVASLGCATIVYPTITDNDGNGAATINTNGKSHLIETAQTSATVGGKRFEHVTFIDQAAGGSQKLTVYDLELAAGTSNFHSDTYCNPDWTGCAWMTNNYTPPGSCTFYTSGTSFNFNCLNFSVLGLCFSSRPGECGRALNTRGMKNLQASEIGTLIGMGIEGPNTLRYNLNAANTRITLQNPTGSVTSLRLAGNTEVSLNIKKGLATVDAGNPLYAVTIRKAASLSDNGFKNGTAELSYGNITRTINYGMLSGDVYRKLLLNRGQ